MLVFKIQKESECHLERGCVEVHKALGGELLCNGDGRVQRVLVCSRDGLDQGVLLLLGGRLGGLATVVVVVVLLWHGGGGRRGGAQGLEHLVQQGRAQVQGLGSEMKIVDLSI